MGAAFIWDLSLPDTLPPGLSGDGGRGALHYAKPRCSYIDAPVHYVNWTWSFIFPLSPHQVIFLKPMPVTSLTCPYATHTNPTSSPPLTLIYQTLCMGQVYLAYNFLFFNRQFMHLGHYTKFKHLSPPQIFGLVGKCYRDKKDPPFTFCAGSIFEKCLQSQTVEN